MVARRRRILPLTLSISLLAALFAAEPTQRAYAGPNVPTYSIAIVADGVTSGSYTVPAGNPDGITLGDVSSEFGFTLPLILATNTGTGWGDCNADGDTSDVGDYVWPTVAAARDGANYTFALCGGEEILFPTLIDGAAISVVAGEGDPAAPNPWNGTSMISSITGTSGTFVWDGTDYFGDLADPDEDGISFVDQPSTESAEGDGTKVVVSASGYGVAAVDLERTAWDGTAAHYTIVKLKSNGRPMEVVNAFGGQTTNIVADGAPCTFYATTSTSPSVWRSFDCGGTWSPVVLSSDERAETTGNDGVEGMDKNSIVSGITTSGWPGEVAVIMQSKLWFSRDFGTSWNSFDLKSYTGTSSTGTTLSGFYTPYWAHAYDETNKVHSSYFFLVSGLIGGPTGPLQALSVYATVMPTSDEYSIVDDNITGIDNPCDGNAADCVGNEIKPGQFFELSAAMKSNLAGAPGGTTRGTWTGWLFAAKPGVSNVYVATQQGAAGGVVIAELPRAVPPGSQKLYTSSDLMSALALSANFTVYDSSAGAEARAAATLFEVRSPYQDVDVDGCANGCALSRDTTVSGGQAAQDLMVFGGPSGWLAEDINNDSTEDNGTLTTDYEGPRSVVIWDRSSSGPTSTATVRIATWVTNDRAITALGSYDNTDHWETAATALAANADADSGDDHVIQNNLYSRNGNSQVGGGCSEDVETEAPVSSGGVGQVGGGGDAGLECESNNPATPDDERRMMASCGENTTPAVGSVAPMLGFQDATGYGATSGEYYGTVAMIRSCIVVHGINVKSTSDIGGAFASGTEYGHVVVMDAPGANNNTGSAFDAGFNFQSGTNGSSVVLSGDGARGLVKAATWKRAGGDGNVKFLGAATANYVPLFPQASHSAWNYIANRADPGTTSSSGGFAVTGMAAPVIRDTAFNPSDPNGVVATFSFTGGGRSVISYDGGQTYYTFAGGGANSISWWKGANEGSGASEQGRNWILSGSLTGGGFSVAHFTDDEWLTARDIANGVLGDDNGDLSDGVSGCKVGVDPNCATVDFDAPVETMSGSALVAGAIREERASPTDPGQKTTGCMDSTLNVGIRGDMFDGEYFGLSGSADTVSITGIQGTNSALVVLGSGPSSSASASDAYTVVLVTLRADGDAVKAGDQPCVDDLFYLKGTSFVQHPGKADDAPPNSSPLVGYTAPLGRIGAVAYCPKDGLSGNSLGVNIADAVEDLLLIAVSDESSTGGFDDGKLIRISGIAGGGTPSVSSPATTSSGYKGGDFRDLKMDCDTGLVFTIKKDAGTGTTASTAAALYSLDGATTFAPMGFASALALKSAISSAETIAVEADPTTGAVDVVVVASGGSVISVEMDLEEMMPAAKTLADLNDEQSEALTAVADDPSAEGDVSTVNDPNSADGFYFGSEKPGDIDYPASEEEAPDLTVDGTDTSEFAPTGFGIASASAGDSATPIFGSGGGALDVTAKMPVFSFGDSLTVGYKFSHASATGITGWHQLPASATESGATQTYAVASTSSAYCEVKTSGGRAYLHIKKPGTCKVGITAAAAAPYLAGTNYYVYTLSKGTLGAPSIVPTSPVSRAKVIQTLGLYADDANTVGYQTSTSVMPKITWSEITTGVTASKNACVLAANKLTLAPAAADAGKTCKIKGTAATSTNWGAWTTTYTITFP